MNKKIKIIKNGPYSVSGNIPLQKEIIETDENGESKSWSCGKNYPAQDNYLLCRCGHSCNKPFCDGSHLKNNFDGTETADKDKYFDSCKKITGPGIDMLDKRKLCSRARFCMRKGDVWNAIEKSDNQEMENQVKEECCLCPSGRLVAIEKENQTPIEPEFEESISLIEDPIKTVSGPIWVKGKIAIESAEGIEYEKRNRVTLCRCGHSCNKPFCDGSHIESNFNDKDKTLNN